jgi:serine/threonine protein kinase
LELFVIGNADQSRPIAVFPALLNGYRLESLAGSGGMGRVFKAFGDHSNEAVAVKFILNQADGEGEFLTRFKIEGEAIAQVKHPNVARFIDSGTCCDLPFLVTEWIDGMSLRQLLDRETKLDVVQSLKFAKQVADGMAELHKHGLIHRDIKPSNLMCTEVGRATKIIDFGIAKRLQNSAKTALTITGTAPGTTDYMSPEQLKTPQLVDQRSDLYSLGICLFEMLTGSLPSARANVRREFERAGLSSKVADLVERLIDSNQSNRPATAAEVAAEIDKLLGCQCRFNWRAGVFQNFFEIENLSIIPLTDIKITVHVVGKYGWFRTIHLACNQLESGAKHRFLRAFDGFEIDYWSWIQPIATSNQGVVSLVPHSIAAKFWHPDFISRTNITPEDQSEFQKAGTTNEMDLDQIAFYRAVRSIASFKGEYVVFGPPVPFMDPFGPNEKRATCAHCGDLNFSSVLFHAFESIFLIIAALFLGFIIFVIGMGLNRAWGALLLLIMWTTAWVIGKTSPVVCQACFKLSTAWGTKISERAKGQLHLIRRVIRVPSYFAILVGAIYTFGFILVPGKSVMGTILFMLVVLLGSYSGYHRIRDWFPPGRTIVKIAIAGTEGAGKSVFITALVKYLQNNSRECGVGLNPKAAATQHYIDRHWDWLSKSDWPPGTTPGTFSVLKWDVHFSGQTNSRLRNDELSMIDPAGHDFRALYTNDYQRVPDKSAIPKALLKLRKHYQKADIVLILVNLRDFIGEADPTRKSNSELALKFVLESASRSVGLKRFCVVFPQSDLYADILEKHGSWDAVFQAYLPLLAHVANQINGKTVGVIAVSAVNKTEIRNIDGHVGRFPAKEFGSEGFGELWCWLRRSILEVRRIKRNRACRDRWRNCLQRFVKHLSKYRKGYFGFVFFVILSFLTINRFMVSYNLPVSAMILDEHCTPATTWTEGVFDKTFFTKYTSDVDLRNVGGPGEVKIRATLSVDGKPFHKECVLQMKRGMTTNQQFDWKFSHPDRYQVAETFDFTIENLK